MISWTRQTRHGGDDWASLDLPLSETQELYAVELWDGGGLVLTKSVTQAECSFTANELTGYGPELQVKIYQISSSVGRGQALTTSISL